MGVPISFMSVLDNRQNRKNVKNVEWQQTVIANETSHIGYEPILHRPVHALPDVYAVKEVIHGSV